MNKGEMVTAIASETGFSKSDSEKFLNAFQKVVTKALKDDDKVALIGFLSMEKKLRAASKGRNPKTGAEIKIPAKNIIKIKSGKQLEDAVN